MAGRVALGDERQEEDEVSFAKLDGKCEIISGIRATGKDLTCCASQNEVPPINN